MYGYMFLTFKKPKSAQVTIATSLINLKEKCEFKKHTKCSSSDKSWREK